MGWVPGYYLIIKLPKTMFGPIEGKLFKGARITVRYVSCGNAFAFQSEVISVTSEPPRLIFIAYPSVVVRHRLRDSCRVLCNLPAEFTEVRGRGPGVPAGSRYSGVISDMSLLGCSFDVLLAVSHGILPNLNVPDVVRLYLNLPGSEGTIEGSTERSGESRGKGKDSTSASGSSIPMRRRDTG